MGKVEPMQFGKILISEIMSRKIYSIPQGSSLQTAIDTMLENKVDGLPVVDENFRPVGIITRTDLIHVLNMNMKLDTSVNVVMSENVLTVNENDDISKVQELMLGKRYVGRLPVVDASKKLVGIITRTDLTKGLANHLSMMNSRLGAIMNSMPDGVIVTDAKGIINFVNPQFTRITDIVAEFTIGAEIVELLPELPVAQLLKGQAGITGLRMVVGKATVLVNASPIFLDGELTGIVAILKDFTEFQKMEQELTGVNEINENLHIIFSSINAGIHAVNRDGIAIFYNEAAAELDGLRPEQVLGRHVLEVFPSLTEETSTLLRVIRTGKPIMNQQQTFKNMKGETVTTINSTIPLMRNGELIGAMEVSQNITQVRRLAERVVDLQTELYKSELNRKKPSKMPHRGEAHFTFDDIIGECEQMLKLKFMAYKASQSASSVLVHGETGTGKELIVQSIHNASKRKDYPFIAQNCAALPESLLEGILFGTVKGGFTGAEDRPGLFELADGGTLFLDEINSMNLELQAKLLRVLQEGVVRRIADTKLRPVDVRVIAATNIDPLLAVEQHKLRPDLYYRLNVVSLRVPPLRERKDDIPLLVQHFLDKYNEIFGMRVSEVSPAAMEIFMSYDWPGNVRELEHTIEGCMNIIDGNRILPEHLPENIKEKAEKAPPPVEEVHISTIQPLRDTLKQVEKELIRKAMKEARGNVSKAALLLKIPRQTLQYKLRNYQID